MLRPHRPCRASSTPQMRLLLPTSFFGCQKMHIREYIPSAEVTQIGTRLPGPHQPQGSFRPSQSLCPPNIGLKCQFGNMDHLTKERHVQVFRLPTLTEVDISPNIHGAHTHVHIHTHTSCTDTHMQTLFT